MVVIKTWILGVNSPHHTGCLPLPRYLHLQTSPESPLTICSLAIVAWIVFWLITVNVWTMNYCYWKHISVCDIVSKLSAVVIHCRDRQHTFSSGRGIALHFTHVHHGRFPRGLGFSLDLSLLKRTSARHTPLCDCMLPLSTSGIDQCLTKK